MRDEAGLQLALPASWKLHQTSRVEQEHLGPKTLPFQEETCSQVSICVRSGLGRKSDPRSARAVTTCISKDPSSRSP